MTSDFTRFISSLHESFSDQELISLCRTLLSLTDEQALWVKERWRSYLSHLCSIPRPPQVTVSNREQVESDLKRVRQSELITELLALLYVITPEHAQPSAQQLARWSEVHNNYRVGSDYLMISERIGDKLLKSLG